MPIHSRDPYGWWCLAAMALVLIAILCGAALAMIVFGDPMSK